MGAHRGAQTAVYWDPVRFPPRRARFFIIILQNRKRGPPLPPPTYLFAYLISLYLGISHIGPSRRLPPSPPHIPRCVSRYLANYLYILVYPTLVYGQHLVSLYIRSSIPWCIVYIDICQGSVPATSPPLTPTTCCLRISVSLYLCIFEA